jgi:hypothetical protein
MPQSPQLIKKISRAAWRARARLRAPARLSTRGDWRRQSSLDNLARSSPPRAHASLDDAASMKRAKPDAALDDAPLRARMRGAEDATVSHFVTRYCWWDKHESSQTQPDRTFPTRRMALLYCAKRNSEELNANVEQCSKSWSDYFTGSAALEPCCPFDLQTFLDLSDEALQEYASGVCNAFSRKKIAKGTLYRYAPKESDLCTEEELLAILQRDRPSQEEQQHHQRQALLLSDIAGFD